ncbi:MAG: hypothetical protein QOE09_2950 [Ilumatobacteraceae bacterium]|jgi:hypothetical protein
MTEFDRLRAVAAGQLGSFTKAQANAAGLSDRELRNGVHSRSLDRAGVRTYRSGLTPRTALGDLSDLVLDIGEPCWVSGSTAAALHHFDGFRLSRPFHIVVPRGRFLDRVGAQIHTTQDLSPIDRETALGLPVLSPTRAMIDICRSTTAADLTAALDGAIRDGLIVEDHLLRRIFELRGRGRHGLPKLVDVISGSEITRGGHSWLEREFLAMSSRAGLPLPLTQQVLTRAKNRLVRVDCRYPGSRVVVELLGYRWHRTAEQLRRDVERMNALVLDGFLPLQFTTAQLIEEPAWIFDTIRTALTSGSAH